jgi:hypothetical protein
LLPGQGFAAERRGNPRPEFPMNGAAMHRSARASQNPVTSSAISRDEHRRNTMSTINTRSVRLSALVLAISTIAAIQTAGSAQAYQCKPGYVQVETIATLKSKSKASGRKLWTNNVKDSLGLQWSVWDIAGNASQDCNFTGAKWYCITKAKPCLYVVQ